MWERVNLGFPRHPNTCEAKGYQSPIANFFNSQLRGNGCWLGSFAAFAIGGWIVIVRVFLLGLDLGPHGVCHFIVALWGCIVSGCSSPSLRSVGGS
jgi:hypothetical protein